MVLNFEKGGKSCLLIFKKARKNCHKNFLNGRQKVALKFSKWQEKVVTSHAFTCFCTFLCAFVLLAFAFVLNLVSVCWHPWEFGDVCRHSQAFLGILRCS